MLELVNLSNISWEIEHVLGGDLSQLPAFFARNGLDGLELTLYEPWNPAVFPPAWIYCVHLRCWPDWLDFWYGDTAALTEDYGSEAAWQEAFASSFGTSRDAWLAFFRQHLAEAARTGARYVVFHVANARTRELYTRRHHYDDAAVIDATLALVNEIVDVLPADCWLLYENLWWPGLTLRAPALAARLIERTPHEKTGLVLDTGHLMNTSLALSSEQEAVRYVLRTVQALGDDLRRRIYAMHLHRSLSGAYVRQRMRGARETGRRPQGFAEIFDYISHVDEHQPFTTPAVRALVDAIAPQVLVHEFIQASMDDWERKVRTQRQALGVYKGGKTV